MTADIKKYIFNSDGIDGLHGYHSSYFMLDGRHGQDGKNADNVTLFLSSNDNNLIAKFGEKNSTIDCSLNNKIEITISSKGGNGGNGEDGSMGHNGSSGERGENGGRGGNGGNSGSGGNGGIVKIISSDKDLDLLVLIKKIDISGGISGIPGKGGPGGRGGSGHNGNNGSNGFPGSPGKKGLNGQNGSSYFIVDGISYDKIYNVYIKSIMGITVSDDSVYEPGEFHSITGISISNYSTMNAPLNSPIVSLDNNENFISTSKIIYNNQLMGNTSSELNGDIDFQIIPYYEPTINKKLDIKTNLLLLGKVSERVNDYYKSFHQAPLNINIEYPVKISMVSSPRSITFLDEAPIAFVLTNISSKPIGNNTSEKRELIIKVSMTDETSIVRQDVKFEPKFGSNTIDYQSYEKGIITDVNISEISNNSNLCISGTIKFDKVLPTNSITKLQVELYLGLYSNYAIPNCIQKSTFNIQQTKAYDHNKNSGFLLVCNSSTNDTVIDNWTKFLKSMNCDVDMYNISYYNGINFKKKIFSNKNLNNFYKNKNIVILNNRFEENNNIESYAFKKIQCTDLFETLKNYNIRIYSKGEKIDVNNYIRNINSLNESNIELMQENSTSVEQFVNFVKDELSKRNSIKLQKSDINFENRSIINTVINNNVVSLDKESNRSSFKEPNNYMPPDYNKEYVNKKENHNCFNSYPDNEDTEVEDFRIIYNINMNYSCCSIGPLENDVIKFIKEANMLLKKEFPYQNIDIMYIFSPKILKINNCSKLYNVGKLIVQKGLNLVDTKFITRTSNDVESIDKEDKFNLIKILRFSKKIELFLCHTLEEITNYDNNKTEFLELLCYSIVSDLVEEQEYYRNSYKAFDKKNISLYLIKLQDWCNIEVSNINNNNFKNLYKKVNIEFLSYLTNILTFYQKLCGCCSNVYYLNDYSIRTIENALCRKVLISKKTIYSNLDNLNKSNKEKFKITFKYKNELAKLFMKGYNVSKSIFNTEGNLFNKYNLTFNNLSKYKEVINSSIILKQNFYKFNNQEERLIAIDKYENQALLL